MQALLLILNLLFLLAPLAVTALSFSPIYAQGDPGSGIGGYDLMSTLDRSFAFDYSSSGKLDSIVLYRPGSGAFWINKNGNGAWSSVYAQGDPGSGIGGYDLKSTADQAFAFDYESSGKKNYIALYRPGAGIFWIIKNNGGSFSPVFSSGGGGIGGYDLKSTADRAFAFDYNHTGKQDHIVLYRPGTGILWIIRNNNGVFSPVYSTTSGIGGYDLMSAADQGLAYDYSHSGSCDHLVFYRPGTGAIFVIKNSGGVFTAVYAQAQPGLGIGGYDLKSVNDRIVSYDVDSTGRSDALALYRPGQQIFWVVTQSGGVFFSVYQSNSGVGGFDLASVADRVYSFDATSTGKENGVVLYRPGTGAFWINKQT